MEGRLHPLLEDVLRRLFEPVLAEHEDPWLLEFRTHEFHLQDEVVFTARFNSRDGGGGQTQPERVASVSRAALFQHRIDYVPDLRFHAQTLWSRMYEDRRMRLEEERADQILQQAADRASAPGATEGDYHQLHEAIAQREMLRSHVGLFHGVGGGGAGGYVSEGFNGAPGSGGVDLADPDSERVVIADVQYGRRVLRPDSFQVVYQSGLINWPGTISLQDPKAPEKGMALLKENLTPAQREQLDKHCYFDVKGGQSGKTYRIHEGRQMNIHELDAKGRPVCGWCFLPQGGLVAGDVMLGQKVALELEETKALAIANRFAVHPRSELYGSFVEATPDRQDSWVRSMFNYGIGAMRAGIIRGGDATS